MPIDGWPELQTKAKSAHFGPKMIEITPRMLQSEHPSDCSKLVKPTKPKIESVKSFQQNEHEAVILTGEKL